MPLLVYCVAPEDAGETSLTGIGGAAVNSTVESGLKFFYSQASSEATWSVDVVTSVQQVHAVISDIFQHATVLPFRYPTVLANQTEIATLVQTRGTAFREYLERMRDKVQMDIRLSLEKLHPSQKPGERVEQHEMERVGQPAERPGTAYLQARAARQADLSAAAEKCRLAADSDDWRIQQRGENIRCQALIPRVEVLSFLKRMHALELPGGVKAAVSGPWPPAGFWDDDSG